MRALAPVLLALAALAAQQGEATKRYGVSLNTERYPQAKPQETLRSVLKAVEGGKIVYLAAHLADPRYIDQRVREHKAGLQGPDEARELVAFDRVVNEIAEHLRADPTLIKELQQILKSDKWEVGAEEASAWAEARPGRRAFFRKIDDRWFLENRQQPKKKKASEEGPKSP